MAKIDCGVTENYAAETIRACRMYNDCSDCPFETNDVCPRSIFDGDIERAKQVIAALQKWSDEHPTKTRLDDLLEKYPSVVVGSDDRPEFYPWTLGYCSNCESCRYWDDNTPVPCWDEPVDGGATGKAVER